MPDLSDALIETFLTENPALRGVFNPRRLSLEAIAEFSSWYARTLRGSAAEAGEHLYRMWERTMR